MVCATALPGLFHCQAKRRLPRAQPFSLSPPRAPQPTPFRPRPPRPPHPSRAAYWEILTDEKRRSGLRFLFNALRFFRAHGVKVYRVMTDNGASFRSRRYPKALRLLKIKHLRTKPYTPKTNGKAERFVQTSLREPAYAQAYLTSDHRTQHLPEWLHRYNWHRPHRSLKSKPPITRLGLTVDTRLRLHI